jgi:hypothetical protein
MTKDILRLIKDINEYSDWRPLGGSADLGYGVCIDENNDVSINRFSRNSLVYPELDKYSSLEDVSKFSEEVQKNVLEALVKFVR